MGDIAEPVIILHGFPTSSYDWVKVLEDLRGKFGRVVIPDFMGFGFSAKPPSHEYSLLEQADMIESLLQNLRIGSAHFLVHDIGDTVMQELLARHNEGKFKNTLQIKSVCLSNGGIFPETNFPRLGQRVIRMPYIGPVVSRLLNYPMFVRMFGEVFGPNTKPTPEEYEDFWAAVVINNGHKIWHPLLQYLGEREKYAERWTSALVNTKLIVHTIYGTADPVNPENFVQFYRNKVRHGISTMPGIGHYPMFEAPEAFIQHYFNFIDKHVTKR